MLLFRININELNPKPIIDGRLISFENGETLILSPKIFEVIYPNISLASVLNWINNHETHELTRLYKGYQLISISKTNNEIKLYRDFFGLSSLFYSIKNNILSVSDDFCSLIDHQDFDPDSEFIEAYLNSEYDAAPIDNKTAISYIKRVLPGHVVEFRGNSINKKPFFQFSHFKHENINTLNSIFKKNIDELFLKNPQTCSHLSGGLDSALITGHLSKIKQNNQAFVLDTGLENQEDLTHAKQLAKQYNTQLHVIKPEKLSVEKVKLICQITGQPELLLFSSYYFFEINQRAKNLGFEQILNGHGGDAILGYGFEYLDDLYEKKEFKKLKIAFSEYYEKRQDILKKYSKINIFEEWKAEFILKKSINVIKYNFSIKKLFKTIYPIFFFKISPKYIFRKLFNYFYRKEKSKKPKGQVSINFGKEFHLNANKYQQQIINNNFVALGIFNLETLNALSNYQGIGQIYPFLDHQVLNTSLNTSLCDNFDLGRGRGIIRNALKEFTDATFYNRVSKGDFNGFVLNGFNEIWNDYQAQLHHNHKVWQYCDKKRFDKGIKYFSDTNFVSKPITKELWYCQRVIFLAIWLDTFAS